MLRFLGMAAMTVLLGFALPSSSFAQEGEDDERARQLFQAGDEYYANGRYEDALAAFEEAYSMSPRPLLLFNMANAQERMGQYDEAIESLENYLPDADDDERARIETRLTSLRARAERVRNMTTVPEPEPEPEPEEPGIDLAGPVLVGAGGAALVGGVVLALRAASARSDLDSLCIEQGERRVCSAEAEDAEARDFRSSIAADVLFVAGAAAVGIGLYFLLRKKDDEEPTNNVEAVVAPGTAYARWSHAF